MISYVYFAKISVLLDEAGWNYIKLMKTTPKMGHFWHEKMAIFFLFFRDETDSSSPIFPILGRYIGTSTKQICSDFGGDSSVINGAIGISNVIS